MTATRILLDDRNPCGACGAPWRVRLTTSTDGDATRWEPASDGECSARCWEHGAAAYEAHLSAIAARPRDR